MPVRYDDPRPPYEQLADELRHAIQGGDYQPGDRLPSTRELAQDNGISQVTVQHALSVLRDEGLIVGQQGRGVYVQNPQSVAGNQLEAREADTPVRRAMDETRQMLAEIDAKLGIKGDDLDTGPRSVMDNLEAAKKALREVDALLTQTPGPDIEPPPPGPEPDVDLGPDI